MSYPTEYDRGVRDAQIAIQQTGRASARSHLDQTTHCFPNEGGYGQGWCDEMERIIKEDATRGTLPPQAPITLAEATHTTLWNALRHAKGHLIWLGFDYTTGGPETRVIVDDALQLKPSSSGDYTVVLSSELERLRAELSRYRQLVDGTGQGSLSWWFARCTAKSLAIKDLQVTLEGAAQALDNAGNELAAQSAYSGVARSKEALLGDAPSPSP